MYFAERTACTHALFTIAISESDARSLRRWVPDDRLLTLPCAFDQEQFHPFYEAEEPERPTVLMVGNYRNSGNQEGARLLVRRVVPRVAESRPDVLFRFIGKNFPEELRHPNVEAVGFVDDLFSEYKRASVVVVPITIGGGIKIKVIEGLACGRFVISTPKGLEGIVSEGLANLRVAEIDDFPHCIVQALEHPAAHTTANWERLSHGYGVRGQLSILDRRIEAALQRPQPRQRWQGVATMRDWGPAREASRQTPEQPALLAGDAREVDLAPAQKTD
jgi:glycosyltransferase involved in cell wall biosynthesis